MRALSAIVGDAWAKIIADRDLRTDARDEFGDRLRVTVLEKVSTASARAATDVSAHNARQQVRLAGIHPKLDPGTAPIVDSFRAENVKLITGLTDEMQSRADKILRDWDAGQVGDLEDALQEGLGWATARANLVARDQTLKLNGQLTRVRQQNAGIEEYVWTTSHDERVRETHDKDGQRFRWDTPPPDTGHPGEDYQCRCTAYPVIPGVEED